MDERGLLPCTGHTGVKYLKKVNAIKGSYGLNTKKGRTVPAGYRVGYRFSREKRDILKRKWMGN